MYKIIGSDGREYGPVDADQLKRWIAEGRADGHTLTQAVGTTDWKPLGAFPEFGPPAPPIIAAAPPPPPRPATNGMAVAGFVLGLLGLVCCGPLFSVLGLVFSITALSRIKRDPTLEGGRSMARAGLALSIIGIVLSLLLGLLFWGWRFWGGYPIRWHRHVWL